MCLFAVDNSNRQTKEVFAYRCGERNDQGRLCTEHSEHQNRSAKIGIGSVLFKTHVHSERTPPHFTSVTEWAAPVIDSFLLSTPPVKVFHTMLAIVADKLRRDITSVAAFCQSVVLNLSNLGSRFFQSLPRILIFGSGHTVRTVVKFRYENTYM